MEGEASQSPPQSPYAPPRAVVEDIEDALPEDLERPEQVRRAIFLLWVSLGIGLVWSLFNIVAPQAPQPMGRLFAFGSYAVGALFSAWLYFKLAQGRNWARILLLVFGAISLISLPYIAMQIRAGVMRPSVGLVSLLTYGLHFYVYYLLLTRPVREWYLSMKGRA